MSRICFVPIGLGHAQLAVDPAGSRLNRDMDELKFNVGVCRRFAYRTQSLEDEKGTVAERLVETFYVFRPFYSIDYSVFGDFA